MYGQSRSAAVVVSYLLSEGMRIDDAVQLVKERRPVTCINPGFLSQLLLLSRRNSQLAQIQLVMRGIIRCRGLKTFDINTAENKETSPGVLTSGYFDCYKPVNIADRKYQHRGSGVIDDGSRDDIQCDALIASSSSEIILDAVGHEQQQEQEQEQETSSTALDGTSGILCAALEVEVADEPQMSSTTTESVECGKCRHVLANDTDIVRAIDYSDFLSNTTDDYWVGYNAIHSSGGHALSLEKCRKVKRKGLNLNGKSVVIKKRSNGTKGNIMQKYSREQLTNDEVEHDIEDLVIVGPLDWILSQLIDESGCSGSTYASAGPGLGQGQSSQCCVQSRVRGSIRCPSCRVICGHYEDNGLDLCNSFIRCELFALHRSKIKIIRSPSEADI